MKYLYQFSIIIFVTFLGELLKKILNLPIPSSVYGLCLMLLFLKIKFIKLEQVKTVSIFLIDIMPLMFIPAGVGLLSYWNLLEEILLEVIIIVIVSTILVMVISGLVAQYIIERDSKNE